MISEFIENIFIRYRIHYDGRRGKFFKFIVHIDILLKLLILLFLWKYLELSIKALRFVHIIPQQSHTSPSACSVYSVNHVVSQFRWFIHVFEHCWYQHWWQVFLSSQIFFSNVQLIPQSHELVEICLNSPKSLLSSFLKMLRFSS